MSSSMGVSIVLSILLLVLQVQLSVQQTPTTCTPYNCSIGHEYMDNPKANAPYSLHIGILQSNFRADPNAVNLARFAAYTINNNPNILPNVSLEIYTVVSTGTVNMDASTIALFQLAKIQAFMVDTDDDSTLSVSQLSAAYAAPVITLTSITEYFKTKTGYPTMLRLSSPNQAQIAAQIKILKNLKKNSTIFIYALDIYGYNAVIDFVAQASVVNITTYAVGVPTSGSTDSAYAQIRNLVAANRNTFIVHVNTAQASRLFSYFNTSGLLGPNYLYILAPNVERAFSLTASIGRFMDGAIGLVPRGLDTNSPNFQPFVDAWGQANTTMFPGLRPFPSTGYMAHDAVTTYAYALDTMMQNSGGVFPTFPTPAFVPALKATSFDGLTGHVSFDSSADRIGEYNIINHQGLSAVVVGTYSQATSTLDLTAPFVFWNGSTTVPQLYNKTVNNTYFCSYKIYLNGDSDEPDATSVGDSGDNGTFTDDSSSGGNSNIQHIITGHIDPTNSSRCICDPGYGGDRCNYKVAIPHYKKVIPGISIALGIITLLAIVVALFAAVMLALFWDCFRKHGSFYCAVIIVGVFFSYASAAVLLPVPTDALCMLFPWLLGIGFTLVYGCLFIKTWALYRVYRSAEKMKKTSLTPMYIIKGIGLYLIIEVVILIIWTTVDRPTAGYHKMVDGNYQLMCDPHPTFWGIFAGTKSLWLAFGAILSILTRNISDEYSQSKSIAYATYNITALLVIAVPLAIALEKVPGGLVIVEVAVIVIAFTFTIISLFFGIWMKIFYPEELPSITMKPTHSSSTGSSPKPSNSPHHTTSSSKGESVSESVVVVRV